MTARADSRAETPALDKYRLILTEVARLHEKYVASNPEPFNIFSVLRSHSDEVNLHSRFLAALLDYRKPNEKERRNLKTFLDAIANVESFDQRGVCVEREKYNIDILITNADKQAVVIENKIWAGDQPEQLQRYHDQLIARDFPDEHIHLRYLTPFGHDPTDQSVGGLSRDRIENIAYKDQQFQDWLRSCQQRAYDLPELRESVGQYLRIVQKLTGTDVRDDHLQNLTELCLEKDNLALVQDLKMALDEAWIHLIREMFVEIEAKLTEKIRDLPAKDEVFDISEQRIRNLVTGTKNDWCGLFYRLSDHSQLGIEVGTWDSNGIFFEVRCNKKNYDETFRRIRDKLEGGNRNSNWWWAWREYANADFRVNPRDPCRAALEIWTNVEKRRQFATQTAKDVAALWKRINVKDLYQSSTAQ